MRGLDDKAVARIRVRPAFIDKLGGRKKVNESVLWLANSLKLMDRTQEIVLSSE